MKWFIILSFVFLLVKSQVNFGGNPLAGTFPVKKNPFVPILSARPSLAIVTVNKRFEHGTRCATRTGTLGDCRPIVRCVRFFFEVESLLSRPCLLPDRSLGVCCTHVIKQVVITDNTTPDTPDTPDNTTPLSASSISTVTNILQPPPFPDVVIPPITASDINSAATTAISNLRKRKKFQTALFNRKIAPKKGTAAFSSTRFHTTNRDASAEGVKALTGIETSQQLSARFKLTKDQGTFALQKFSLLGSKVAETCPVHPSTCPATKYRTTDGSCNNLKKTGWGKANIALQRILQADYDDGVSSPRQKNLPSPRSVSAAITTSQDRPETNYTLMVMQWGQFTDHDITHTPTVHGDKDSGILCCDEDGGVIDSLDKHPECFPINIPSNDRVYSQFQQTCMDFVRSLPAPRPDCNFGPREQMNQITAFIDGSNIYGSDPIEAKKLRLLDGGRLRVTRVQGREMLPLNPTECGDPDRHRYCFTAGDLRCNEQLELTILHTVWMREHNRVAGILEDNNPDWDDEKLYQEARRIVIGQLQHITYNEWLPIILGNSYMRKWHMEPLEEGQTNAYNKDVNPSITNVFATAAFRFGHSMVQGHIESYNLFGTKMKSTQLSKTAFAPYELYDNVTLENYVRGLTTQKNQKLDSAFPEELTSRLFKAEDENVGMDLVALNIQRGRDHGLPSWTNWRKICKLPPINSWKQLSQVFLPQVVPRLQSMYSKVEDIDIFVGGLLEMPDSGPLAPGHTRGSILGPTFLCLVGDQFARLKAGDRFWYEEGGRPTSFTSDQLREIKRTSLARVLCDNSDDLTVIQPLAFHSPGVMNRRVSCDSASIPRMDLAAWS